MADFRSDDEISIRGFLFRDHALNRHEDLCEDPKCGARPIHESGAIGADVNCDYDVGAEVPRVTNRKVRYQSAINQQSPVGVAHGDLESRQANTGADRERKVAGIAHYDCSAVLQIGSQRGKRDAQIFEAGNRQAGAQKFFHRRI